MIIKGNKTFCAPFKPYGDSVPNMEVITFRDGEHTPYNKRPKDVDRSIVEFRATRNGGDTFNINVEEITTAHSGRVAGRTISVDMPLNEAVKLANFILDAVAIRNML